MNDNQTAFCQEYMIDRNATQAAIRAGYSKRSAASQGQRLLKSDDIHNEIRRLGIDATKRNGVTVDRILQALSALAFSDIRKIIEWGPDGILALKPSDEIDDTTAAAIVSLKVGKDGTIIPQLATKEKALEMLGRYVGLFEADKEEESAGFHITLDVKRKEPTKISGYDSGK